MVSVTGKLGSPLIELERKLCEGDFVIFLVEMVHTSVPSPLITGLSLQ